MKASPPKIFGIASGKGGVGKTTLAVNIALLLAQAGQDTLLLDADTGLANTQILLGLMAPFNLGHVLLGERTIEEALLPVASHLDLITGASGVRHLGSLRAMEATAIVRALSSLQKHYDYVVVDIAAGISDAVMTFLEACQYPLIVLKDEPAAISDAYSIVKIFAEDLPLDAVHLIPNSMTDKASGERLHFQFNQICERFLGQSIGLAGVITQDALVPMSHRQKKPLIQLAPQGPASRDLVSLSRKLMELPPGPVHGGTQFFVERLLSSPATPAH